jgi:hypothetical protein
MNRSEASAESTTVRSTRRFITPWDLLEAPELASLATLRDVLRITNFAMIAAHPEIAEPEFRRDLAEPEARIANRIIDLADGLQRLIRSYRQALRKRAKSREPDDDHSF